MAGNENNLVQAIYTFKGKNNDELCFKKGDIITVTQREEGGWWEGTLGEVTGWFPSNYVKEYKDSGGGGSAATSPVRAPLEVQAFRDMVLKDIIDSETAHVAELQGLVNNFLKPLESSDILTRDEYRQLTGNILEVLQVHEELLALIEECGVKQGPNQRVGGLFLQWAPKIKSVHEAYCSSHPRAVCILDKYKDELDSFMERCGAVCPGILVLTTGLSKPFRRLHKYAAMLQELGRHVVESHPDRGDTHRAVVVYKDIASSCAATRRQKELELQVVTGAVRGWKCPAGLGEVLHMGGVALGAKHHDRYLVLFPTTLLVLSVSKRMSAFVYEGSLPLTGITVIKLEDTDTRKNAFEISGPLIETIVAVCQTNTEAEKWVSLLQQHSNQGPSAGTGSQSQSPAHESDMSSSNTSLNRTRSRNPRESIYHVTLPPTTYPPASPYTALSKYFAKLIPTVDTNITAGTNDMVAINHKRSHSFNNHHSYTQYLHQQQNNQSTAHYKNQHNEINTWLQASSEALAAQNISPSNTAKLSNSSKMTAFEFAEKLSLSSNFKGWTVKSLRPAPPLRPLFNLGEEGGGTTGGVGAAHPYASLNRKINSYEEDGLILRVIEAYCTSARSRHTINSDTEDDLLSGLTGDWLTRSPSLPLTGSKGAPSPWPTILHLQQEVRQLRAQIEQEREERIIALASIQPHDPLLRDAKESKC